MRARKVFVFFSKNKMRNLEHSFKNYFCFGFNVETVIVILQPVQKNLLSSERFVI
jgi:hypothetical protein